MTLMLRQGDKETRKHETDQAISLSPCLPVSVSTLVIGYGNDLRGDDAVGQRVALSVARWRRPGVMAIATHQLTPELASWLVPATFAIFVDASRPEGESSGFHSRRIEPSSGALMHGHTADPQALLALTLLAYGRCPTAWWITIPAQCFDFGAELSPKARRGAAAALRYIRARIHPQGAIHARS
jgi:hydrogenase maturation protease